MQQTILTSLLLFTMTFTFGQTDVVNSEPMSRQEIQKLFPDSLLMRIAYPIFRVYKCTDKSGHFFIVLAESNDQIINNRDTLNYNIKAVNFHQVSGKFVKQWEINDFIIKQTTNGDKENSIWFWTTYSEFSDIDKDGLIDPILVYGTSGMNHTSDGRIKILIHYKGEKIAIRHQNGTLDSERNTRVDQAFYSLPLTLQDYIKRIMKKMTDDNRAIFPYGWQTAMKNHKLYFDENKQ